MSAPPPRFTPLTVASRPARIAVAMIGPLLWLAAFSVLAVVAEETSAILHGLLIAVASFVIAVAALVPMRRARIRAEGVEGAGDAGRRR